MPDEIKIKITTEGVEEAQYGFNRVGDGVENVSGKMTRVERLTGQVRDGFRLIAATALSFSGVLAALNSVIGALERLRDLQRQIGQQSLAGQGGMVQLASQLGDTGPGGVRKAAGIAGEIARAGGIDLSTATGLAMAGDVALGGLTRGRNLETLKAFAGLVGSIGANAGQASGFMEFLQSAGATGGPEALLGAAGKVMAAAGAAKGSKAEFVGQLTKGGIPLLSQGVPLENVLELAVQARNVAASGDLAAEVMKTAARVSAGGGGADALLGAQAGRRGMDFRAMPMAARIGLLRELFASAASPEDRAGLQRIVSGAEFLALGAAFSKENLAATAGARGAIASATPAGVQADIAQYLQTDYAKDAAAVAADEVRRIVAPALSRIERTRAEAARDLEMRKASGEWLTVGSDFSETTRGMAQIARQEALQAAGRTGPDDSAKLRAIAGGLEPYTAWRSGQVPDPLGLGRNYVQDAIRQIQAIVERQSGKVQVMGNVYMAPDPVSDSRPRMYTGND